jgi:hypothetical protein
LLDLSRVQRFLARPAISRASPEVLRLLESPRPVGSTSRDAMRWYAAWVRILLLDLRTLDETVTHEAAAGIIGLPDASRIAAILDRLRANNDDADPLTNADFARVFKSH